MSVYGIKKIFHSAVTETHSSDKEGAGTLRFEGDKVYKYVKFSKGSGANAAAKNACVYADTDGATVSCDASAGLAPAGVLMAAIADGEYGWIQIAGVCTGVAANGTINAGVAVTTDTTDGKVDAAAVDGTDTGKVLGNSLAAAAGGTVTLLLRAF